MKAEILFPEVCNLYGDLQNIYYLKRCCPALEIIETDLHSKPRFLTEDVALSIWAVPQNRGCVWRRTPCGPMPRTSPQGRTRDS